MFKNYEAPMLSVAAKIFTILQKEGVSFGSLETKYLKPDNATINANEGYAV